MGSYRYLLPVFRGISWTFAGRRGKGREAMGCALKGGFRDEGSALAGLLSALSGQINLTSSNIRRISISIALDRTRTALGIGRARLKPCDVCVDVSGIWGSHSRRAHGSCQRPKSQHVCTWLQCVYFYITLHKQGIREVQPSNDAVRACWKGIGFACNLG